MRASEVLAGKYQLVALLGQGGMGSVWRAQHLGLNAPVAVKLIDPALAGSGEGLARFHREAQAAAALRSPHVVQVLDHGVDPNSGQPFIVMELMEGQSLAARIVQEGRLMPAETARIVSHIARALTRAHAAGIVHRDLKPDNVFLVQNDDEEIAKVLDFGIAKSEAHRLGNNSATETGAVMGTPYYMSPEQISGSRGVDFRTDLWALGVIACECLTGRRPFEAETIGGLALKICAEAPPRPSLLAPVPQGFDAWFERATARDPNARFQSAREVADSFRNLCSGVLLAQTELAAASPFASAPNFDTASSLSRSASMFDELPPPRSKLKFVLAGLLALVAAGICAALWLRAPSTDSNVVAPNSASAALPSAAQVAPPSSIVSAETNSESTPILTAPPRVEPVPAVATTPAAPAAVQKLPPRAAKGKKVASAAEASRPPATSRGPETPARSGPTDVLDERR